MSSVHVESQHPEHIHFPNHDSSDRGRDTGNTLAKSQILGGVRASVPRSTIITQGRQAIIESRGRYRLHNFSKPVTHKQKHRNRRMSNKKCNLLNIIQFQF